jgi:hypothetical protein
MNPTVVLLIGILGLIIVLAALVMVNRYDLLLVLVFGIGVGYYARMRQKSGKE